MAIVDGEHYPPVVRDALAELPYEFVGAVLAHAAEANPSARLRMSILRWNDRSRRVAEAHGFRVVDEAGEFDVLVREATRRTDGAEYRPS